jgi:hypothetical protein
MSREERKFSSLNHVLLCVITDAREWSAFGRNRSPSVEVRVGNGGLDVVREDDGDTTELRDH